MDTPAASILIYQGPDGQIQLKVQPGQETAWLTQAQMVELLGVSKRLVGEHINTVLRENELVADAVVRESRTTASDGKTCLMKHYNLDVVIAVGYRVKSLRGTHFRQWATGILRQFLVQGHVLNGKELCGSAR